MVATGPSIPCPKCKKVFTAENWHRDGMPVCQRCSTVYELIDFPALYREVSARDLSGAEAAPEDSSCFFHPHNRAEHVCEGCGRYLCPVCTVDFGGRKLCPSCIAHGRKKAPEGESSRVLWDGIALALAVVPLLLWPTTVVTAPAALGAAIVGWKKPSSLVRGKKLRLVLAMIISSLEIIAWLVLLGTFIFGKIRHG